MVARFVPLSFLNLLFLSPSVFLHLFPQLVSSFALALRLLLTASFFFLSWICECGDSRRCHSKRGRRNCELRSPIPLSSLLPVAETTTYHFSHPHTLSFCAFSYFLRRSLVSINFILLLNKMAVHFPIQTSSFIDTRFPRAPHFHTLVLLRFS